MSSRSLPEYHSADAMDLKVKRIVVTPSGTRYVPEYVSHFLLSARSDVVGVEMVVIFSPTLLPFSDAMRVASCAVSLYGSPIMTCILST